MKKIIIIIIMFIIGFICGNLFTMNNLKVDIIEEQEQGVLIRIISFDQWYNYYLEK